MMLAIMAFMEIVIAQATEGDEGGSDVSGGTDNSTGKCSRISTTFGVIWLIIFPCRLRVRSADRTVVGRT